VFLTEPSPTPYDLNFRIFGVPVRVHPLFWLISILLNMRLINQGQFGILAIWIVCVFVSILIHELGHVFMGQVFGSRAHVVLYSFGGLAVGSTQGLSRWQRIAVLFAGPGAGFVFCGTVWAAYVISSDYTEVPLLARIVISDIIVINLFWGIMNLLPVWPLDGGQITGELCSMRNPRGGLRVALRISIVVAGAVALLAFADNMDRPLLPFRIGIGLFGALMFAMLAYGSYEMLQQLPRDRDPFDDSSRWERAPWEKDPDEWRRR